MEFTKIRIENLPTEEDYVKKTIKDYQSELKMHLFKLVTIAVITIIFVFGIIFNFVASNHMKRENIFLFGVILSCGCRCFLDAMKEYIRSKKDYILFQKYLSFNEEEETKFVQEDTFLFGTFDTLYFLRMLKENPTPCATCYLFSEDIAELIFKYKDRKFTSLLQAKEVTDGEDIEAEKIKDIRECIYDFGETIYYKREMAEEKEHEEKEHCKAEIVVEAPKKAL